MLQADPIRLQFALFHNKLLTRDSLEIAQGIRQYMSSIFPESPVVLPAQGAPPDFPRLIFKSSDGYELVITQERTDLFINKTNEITLNELLNSFLQISTSLAICVTNSYDCALNRLGFIIFCVLNFSEPGKDFIQRNYLKEEFPKDILKSEVHWLIRPSFKDESLNRWVRIKSLTNNNDQQLNSVELIIDTNTIPNQSRQLDIDFIKDFSSYCAKSIINNLEEILLL